MYFHQYRYIKNQDPLLHRHRLLGSTVINVPQVKRILSLSPSFDLKFLHFSCMDLRLRTELSNLKYLVTIGPGLGIQATFVSAYLKEGNVQKQLFL